MSVDELPKVWPLEWHPWYRDKTWLLDWLNGEGPYKNPVVRLPLAPSLRSESMTPESAELRTVTLTKHQMQGPAPYVGKPFVYVWTVGIDNLGRGIAGDSERLYPGDWWRGNHRAKPEPA